MLVADAIDVRVGSQSLLQQVSLAVKPGDVLALLGPNGAGKSTLLKTLVGERRPANGRVTMDDRPLAAWPLRERACRRAVLPQDSTLPFPFTVLEVVLMGRSPHGSGDSADDRRIAQAALAAAEVDHLAARVYPTLSGGERQRVQLARVLAQIWEVTSGNPRYLLLDEPTASLDLNHQHATLRLARRFARQGVGVLAVLHDLNLAAEYADRIAILRDGRLVAVGTPGQVLTPETIESAFTMPVMVIPHPTLNCPLIVPTPTGLNSAGVGR